MLFRYVCRRARIRCTWKSCEGWVGSRRLDTALVSRRKCESQNECMLVLSRGSPRAYAARCVCRDLEFPFEIAMIIVFTIVICRERTRLYRALCVCRCLCLCLRVRLCMSVMLGAPRACACLYGALCVCRSLCLCLHVQPCISSSQTSRAFTPHF